MTAVKISPISAVVIDVYVDQSISDASFFALANDWPALHTGSASQSNVDAL